MSRHPMTFIIVDLPLPDAPMMATNSPRSTTSETLFNARTSVSPAPKTFSIRSRMRAGHGFFVGGPSTVIGSWKRASRPLGQPPTGKPATPPTPPRVLVPPPLIAVRITTMSPAFKPLVISTDESPRRPIVIGTCVSLPVLARTVTVAVAPRVDTAEVGRLTTPSR